MPGGETNILARASENWLSLPKVQRLNSGLISASNPSIFCFFHVCVHGSGLTQTTTASPIHLIFHLYDHIHVNKTPPAPFCVDSCRLLFFTDYRGQANTPRQRGSTAVDSVFTETGEEPCFHQGRAGQNFSWLLARERRTKGFLCCRQRGRPSEATALQKSSLGRQGGRAQTLQSKDRVLQVQCRFRYALI